jgi:hypothetical protein
MADSGSMRGIGDPCPDGVCAEGDCTLVGDNKYCTVGCPPACPSGTYCSIINGNPLCVPDLGQQCDKCTTASDCKLPSDACLTAPPGDQFCARDCTADGMCPNGFTCVNMGSYDNPDAGADAGDAGGSDAGLPSMPTMWCVPDSGASCPCNTKRDGVTHTCANTNTFGTCTGMETCDGKSSSWMGCSAKTPAAETCNNMDDDCNGKVDDGSGNTLCASQGPVPPHASWACNSGMCQLGTCDPGWTAFPSGNTTTGCSCQVDANEPNGTCAQAKDLGTVTDIGQPLAILGTLSGAGDIDVYTFQASDTPEGNVTNSYHVAISFTAPATNTEFVMDVIRGGACSDTPTGAGTSITSYDWCVAGSAAGPIGEAGCGDTAAVHCGNHSIQYWLRVYRAVGATPTCTPYQITIAGGGGTCDFSQQCM